MSLDLNHAKLNLTHLKFNSFQVRFISHKVRFKPHEVFQENMFKFKINPNLVVFGFCCKSQFNCWDMEALFVISGHGWHPRQLW